MINRIIGFSIHNKLIIILFTISVAAYGVFAVFHIPVGAVPDITNNQVQVITVSPNLSTQDVEQFITYPVELEMSNLPGVNEIRSISKFGLSVVTIVFDDEMGTYLPRQLISEKIKSATANIPEEFGIPEMGPITTGLGEIYQYVLDVKEGYENRYSPMEMRTIQDWVVKRQLSGIPGVVEVNTWGGYLKQYEVAINPERLKSLNINLLEVYDAVASNNSIAGGAYIEKQDISYFIRGDGLVKSLDDIANIVIKNVNGKTIYVRDIARVRFGHANRFGAITANGEGEKVMGQIMMLKGANSKKVINAVRERVAEVQKSLPEGVFINPIVERSELIGKTSFTIVENLLLGCLIVMVIVILLLGNLRAALVIASLIPLALLFTISLMYIFGIDANLMSLGALDFGIIIDGAVIIVEYIALKVSLSDSVYFGKGKTDRQSLIDNIAYEGASKMINSAIFGQVIILIVLIPILVLSGVEGKMFRPMAISFSFAIIGAMVFGLTWIPVASALFLKPSVKTKKSIADRIMNLAYASYTPVINLAYNYKGVVFTLAFLSLIFTGYLFTRIGGEFVPTLDEGDFVIQPVFKTGTSLSKTIQLTTKIERILKNNFPEVDQIVSRIGAAEVPTDPMSMEEVDVIIKLKPKSEWVTAGSKEELANKFKEALEVIPGVEYEFTQPIEMRFNELITGVRADIAVKIFGEDLEYLSVKAKEIKRLIDDIPGAADVIVEKTEGLPQMIIKYKRDKVAYYGLSTGNLNKQLSMAFGGAAAGKVFEGEKRFDLVIRFEKNFRKKIENIKQMNVALPGGEQVPLEQLADIKYTKGPAKISRDNTHRRVVVSVNVRNRDLESVVKDIQSKIDKNIIMEPGYYIEYGGQFENLKNAVNRLKIAVPVALLLIFIFLHFAFKSFKEAAMIFTAVPLSAVGGVLFLWIRGMPFSVSAGIGFIALFGVAVLNGIVLIEHLKELKNRGMADLRELIMKATHERLRPVLLTASAAALGFLPMAISTSAGAEVQRPLATVVIGGLVTSTLLTMIALPLLYAVLYNVNGVKLFPPGLKRNATAKCLLLLLLPAVLLAGCNNNHGITEQDTASPALIYISNKQFEEGGMKLGNTLTFDFEQLVSTNGIVTASPQSKADVYSLVSGIVKSVNVNPGNYVDKGKVLCTLVSSEFIGMQQQYLEAVARMKAVEAEYLRKKTLFEKKIASEKDFISAESEYKMLIAEIEGLKAGLKMLNIDIKSLEAGYLSDYYSVKAPVSGYIANQKCNTGQSVNPAVLLMKIIDTSDLQLHFFVYQESVKRITKGQKVKFYTPGDNLNIFEGEVISVGKAVDPDTKSIDCIAKPEKRLKDYFVDGMYFHVDVTTGSTTAPALPVTAIIDTGDRKYILVKEKEDENGIFFKKVEIETGMTSNGYVRIKSNKYFENVLIKGTYYFK